MGGFLDDAIDDGEADDGTQEPEVIDESEKEVELVAEDDTTATTQEEENTLLTPVANIDEVVEVYDQFEEIKEKLIDNSDLSTINGNPHVNKSGWRKIATAFNVSIEVVESKMWQEDGIVKAEAEARAIASNGKFATSTSMCASNESNHMVKLGDHPDITDPDHDDVYRIDGKWRVLKDPKEVKEHNIITIAETRAKNRAISDLVGGGEVSAEEMGADILDA